MGLPHWLGCADTGWTGHDTTSSTICYAAYELSKNANSLARIRKEHDEILGPVAGTPQKIKNDPYVLNKLEYTSAVIRETLRLWPAASSTRTGFPGFKAYDPKTGELLETEDMLVWVSECDSEDPRYGNFQTMADPFVLSYR